MRTFICVLLLLLAAVISPVFWLILLIVKLFSDRASGAIASGFIRALARIGRFIIGIKMHVDGADNIPKDRAVVFALNHRSIFDIVLTYPYTHGPIGFIAKKELKKVPIFNVWLWFAHCLFLDRKNIREGVKTIKKGVQYVKNGISMGIFPEGTRNKDRENMTSMAEFHDASFKLAERPDAPIIPVAIYNSAECFENHKPWFRPAEVRIKFGAPIVPSELEGRAKKFLGKHVQAIVQEMLNEEDEEARK
ncbi:MAG: 1-acyl-sn-glycerol-3-phosphate acyltransferase [Lachnospiraceae bacterium]|nr:1-acyl-sn-glycerol-3-phosphate acyltransferase [Lachnospiraceae bacterium]